MEQKMVRTSKSSCRQCDFVIDMGGKTRVGCNYILKTLHSRKCPVGQCDKYEPNVVKAAWNIFGKSYLYRQKYNEYKEKRRREEKAKKENSDQIKGQMEFKDFPEVMP